MYNQISSSLNLIRHRSPLIHNISNFVTMDLVANGLLAMGASPIMAHASEELTEIINISESLSLNIGTLDDTWIKACKIALRHAQQKNIPVVLDPVGAGATKLRTRTSIELLEQGGIKFIKGNASEIIALSGKQLDSSKGVENTSTLEQALDAGKALAEKYNICVVITGKQDAIISAQAIEQFTFGHPIMTKVTGIGCLLNSVIATFATLPLDAFAAAKQATLFFAICGEEAAKNCDPLAPASFRSAFINQLYLMNQTTLSNYLK